MRKNFILLVAAVAIVVLLLWLHFNRLHSPKPVQPVAIDTNQEGSQPNHIGSNPSAPVPAKIAENGPTPESNFGNWNSNRMKQMESASQDVMNEWRTPILFYGKVVDENTNEVAGAQIRFSCNDLSSSGTSTYTSISDDHGTFSIQGINGKLLTVNVSKEGYYSSKTDNDSFYYAGQNVNFTPDLYNPVIFHLRKKGNGELLIMFNYPGFAHIAQLQHDGTPIELDLLNGTQAPAGAGQLKLEFWKSVAAPNTRTFDWKLQLSIPGGGLVPTDGEFDFQAPENGYRSSIIVDMPATNQTWQAEINTKYYFQLPNGNFGRIHFYLLPRNGAFTVQSAVNPSGSRNLEPEN